jgi:hypothetical protein
MAQTLMGKVATLLSASFHNLIDNALKGNPIPVLKDLLRQYEEAYNEMEQSLGATGGNVRTAKRKVLEYDDNVNQLNSEITRILTDSDPNNDSQASPLTTNMIGKEKLRDNEKLVLQSALAADKVLRAAYDKMGGRIISLVNQIKLLEAISEETAVKNMTADILIRSAGLISSHSVSVDEMAEEIKQKRDHADARLELAMNDMSSAGGQTSVEDETEKRLAQIRANLGVDQPVQTESSSSSLDMTQEELHELAQR